MDAYLDKLHELNLYEDFVDACGDIYIQIFDEWTEENDLSFTMGWKNQFKVENFVEQLIALDQQTQKESAFRAFMDKMKLAEKSAQENCLFRDSLVKT